jgi:N-methylhydantoinase A
MTFRASIDVGGTFTDLVFTDENGELAVFKSLTTPRETWKGMIDALRLAAESYQMPLSKLLAESTTITYSGTTGTNAIITGTGAKVGLICTRGFRDILLAREGPKKESAYDWPPYPEPYVPRYLTLPVTERINAEGGIDIPLNEDEVRQVVRQFKEWNVEAIAVSLLWSISNPIHEKRIGEIVKEELPGIPCVLSHELNPIIREYRRTISAAIDASLHPILVKDVEQLNGRLNESGFRGNLLVGTASGGVLTPEEACKRPIYTIGSGPALGPVAAKYFAQIEAGNNNVIVLDMGGTSFDVSIVTKDTIVVTRETMVKDEILPISRVDARSVGSGGGSIAWIDPGKLMHVGPQSSGAQPGPACYTRGGKEATVSDANLTLGYLDPDYFLGGRMKLSPQSAREVIQDKVAKPLSLDVPEAAFTVFSTVTHDMIAAIRDITIWQGIDPREYLIVSGGGATGMHVVPMAQELGVKQVLIPKVAGTLSALGGLVADITTEYSASYFAESYQFNYEGVNRVLEALQKKGEEFLAMSKGISREGKLEYFVESRYPYEVWELSIPLRSNRIKGEKELAKLVEDFHNTHERIFAVKEPGQSIECVIWRVVATAKTPQVKAKEIASGGKDPSAAITGKRDAYFRDLGGFVKTPIYRGDKLVYGNRIDAPAIIEEATTTIVIFPGSKATVTKWGNYLIEVE